MAAKVLEDNIEEDKDIGNLLDGIKSIKLNNYVHTNDQNISLWLRNFESPFHWHTELPRALASEYMIERCLEKLSELNSDEQSFSLRRYSILLKLLLEYSEIENKTKCIETLETIKKSIARFSDEGNSQYEKVKIMLDHVILTTEAHILALDGKEEESKKIAKNIVPINQMSNSNKAGLNAVKANFFLYSGYEGSEDVAVELVREAKALEPENHEWFYLLAKMLRQQRKEKRFNSIIPEEELTLLEEAVQQCKTSKYLQYLAQVYRESASQAFKQHKSKTGFRTSALHKTITNMQHASLSYYLEALEMDPNHAGNLRRIGYGIMNLPYQLADYKLAKECLFKSLELCYNINTVHIIGTFYHRFEKDNKKALEYYEETANAGSHAGLSDMIRVRYIENPKYNPCEDIERGLQSTLNKKNRIFLLTQRSGYFLFVKRNFLKSIDSFNQAVSEDKDSKHLTEFKTLFLRMIEPINLYECMANEALLYLQQNESSSEDKDEEDNKYEVMALIFTITNIHPELGEFVPDPHFIDKLCEKSKEIVDNEKFKNRSYQHERKHNFQGGRQGGFQQRGNRGSSGREGASEYHNNRRGRPSSRNWRSNEEGYENTTEKSCDKTEEEKTGRFSGYSKGRGQYPNRGKQGEKTRSWRKNE